jgi:biotin operon repressor
VLAGTYTSRAEAEAAVKALQSEGVPATVLETRGDSLRQITRLWQVIVPRGWTAEVLAPFSKEAGT